MGRDVGCVPRHFIHRLGCSPATEYLCVLFQLKGKYVTVKYLVVMLLNPTQMFRSSPHAFRGFFFLLSRGFMSRNILSRVQTLYLTGLVLFGSCRVCQESRCGTNLSDDLITQIKFGTYLSFR